MTRHWKRWLIAGIGLLIAAVVIGPLVYKAFNQAPDELSVAKPSGAGGVSVPADGTWKVQPGSQAGYRVKEVLFGQDTEAVGRTGDVTGDLTIAGTQVTKGSFTVKMETVKSDRDQRDGQFRGRIMDVATYPTSAFTLSAPIELGTAPAVGAQVTAKATGKLTLKAQTRDVSFDVTASRTGPDAFEVSGRIPVKFTDYGIQNPSLPGISVRDDGLIEFLLKFTR